MEIEAHNQLIENLYASLLTNENVTCTGSPMISETGNTLNSHQQIQQEQFVPSDTQVYQDNFVDAIEFDYLEIHIIEE